MKERVKPGWRGWTEAKAEILKALDQGRVLHESRRDQKIKNLLACGEVEIAYVSFLVELTRGNTVTHEPHDQMPDVQVWILRPKVKNVAWYVKCYIKQDVIFISVHRQ